MLRRSLLAALFAALPGLARGQGAMRVVASFSILADMAREVGGEAVSVVSLVPPDADVHLYQPRPGDLRALQAASVLVENGLGLEGSMTRMAKAAGFAGTRITAAAAVAPRQLREGGRAVVDPHAWQDPRNGLLYARAIAAGLTQAMPAQAGAIGARAAAYAGAIEAVDREIAGLFAPIPPAKRRIITSHDAFGYFAARYGITMIGVQGVNTESEPSARDIARLAAQIRREGIRAVFVENMTDDRTARTLAREAGVVMGGRVYSDALSAPGGPADTYLKMLRHNATLFARAMAEN